MSTRTWIKAFWDNVKLKIVKLCTTEFYLCKKEKRFYLLNLVVLFKQLLVFSLLSLGLEDGGLADVRILEEVLPEVLGQRGHPVPVLFVEGQKLVDLRLRDVVLGRKLELLRRCDRKPSRLSVRHHPSAMSNDLEKFTVSFKCLLKRKKLLNKTIGF